MFGKSSDMQLINQALKGSERSWVKLVKRYEARVYNYALRHCSLHDDALDLTQDVFLAVYRNLPNYRGDSSFATWLFRIVANRGTDLFRKKNRTPDGDDEATQWLADPHTPEGQFENDRRNSAIRDLLQSLHEDQRIVVEMKFFQHFTFEEIATLLGVSTNTVKSRLYAALQKLRNTMEVSHVV